LFSDQRRTTQNEYLRTALEGGLFRIDASDVMPPQVGSDAFPEGLVTYLTWSDPSLRQVLIETQAAWP
jgi:hypothetical protein